MGNNWIFFVEPGGGSVPSFPTDPLLPQSAHWLTHISSFIDNSRYHYVPGSAVLQGAFNCMSKFAGALVVRFGTGSNRNIGRKLPGNHLGSNSCSASVKHASDLRNGFFWNSKHRRKFSVPIVFGKISSFVLKQICKEAGRIQSFPVLTLAAALVPPFTNVSSNVVAIPLQTTPVEAERCTDQKPCEVENRGCGPFCGGDVYFHNLARDDNKTVEPRTGVQFPTMLGDFVSGENNCNFTPEVLVATGSRTMTIIRIKSLKVYAFGFYVHPFDVCEKLGPKYACIPEDELNKRQDFYQDLLREDINMTIRLVINYNGIKINTVKDAFEKSLRARLARTNPHADFSCLQTFGSLFSQDIPLHVGTIINFRRTTDGHLITEVGGNNLGAVQSKDLCRAFFDMYIGDIPVCQQTKDEIGKNVASIMKSC